MSHNAEIISVGTELLLGNIVNSDAQMISQGLSELGINVYYHTVVGDNPERLRAAVEQARKRADIIITTGGLGPTCDDLTKNVLAECFGKKLRYDEESACRIEAAFASWNGTMTENNYQQAMLPEGCTVLANDWGTAPGVAFEADGVCVIMLPGPPRECREMFRYRAAPYLRKYAGGDIVSRSLRIFGMGESHVESLLRDKMNAMQNPTLAPYAKEGEVELRITAKAPTEEEARALIAPVEKELRALLGPVIYGADVASMEAVVLDLLKERGLTLGCAESCTGGLIAKRITDLPGASAVFRGGVVSYTDQVKRTVLGVPNVMLAQYSAVSEQVARAMAEGARQVLGCDIAVSTTGVAGPGSDERGNPVGLVFVAIAAPERTHVRKLMTGGIRERSRNLSTNHAFDLIRRYLTGLQM